MDKLRMQTVNKADENFRKLAAMFPNDTAHSFCDPARYPCGQALYVQEQPGGVHHKGHPAHQ